jgi:hypothetical protein
MRQKTLISGRDLIIGLVIGGGLVLLGQRLASAPVVKSDPTKSTVAQTSAVEPSTSQTQDKANSDVKPAPSVDEATSRTKSSRDAAEARGVLISTAYKAKIRRDRSIDAEIMEVLEPNVEVRADYDPKYPGWATVYLNERTGYVLAKQLGYKELARKLGREVKGYVPGDPNDPELRTGTKVQGDEKLGRSPSLSRSLDGSTSGGLYLGTGDSHWIRSVSDGGSVIELEDGSRWLVDTIDRVETALWLATDDVIVHESSSSLGGHLMINTSQDEKVGARFLGDN